MLLTIVVCPRLEKIIRDLVASDSFQRVEEILEQLCNDYAYAVHQPHARNGGLIGLAAAAIALGTVCSTFGITRVPTAIYERRPSIISSCLLCCISTVSFSAKTCHSFAHVKFYTRYCRY